MLCPALEEHRAELASMVGLEADPDRPVAVSRSECIVRGTDGGFVRVSLAPAATPSIALHVEGYDSPVSPAPGLGSDAVFVDVSGQPHVVFRLGSLILDVDAESSPAPDRESMLSLGAAVKGILADANS
ncbi:MAG TPA: hypothetical protein VKA44_01900 [Gemmatimonadota bacterium]|nr:hypothetical protein [Gemmatimonadota bacterium]